MGIIINQETTKNPITLIGQMAGTCYGANITDPTKNYNRGIDCIKSNHGRTLEFPQVFVTIEGYSARVIREIYTHLGGMPTRLQASTRYINYYGGFDYIIPPSITKNEKAWRNYVSCMDKISEYTQVLKDLDIPKEDIANLLPLGMTSTMVLRTNLRNLIDMSHQRECMRAYWEFRDLFKELKTELSNYSEEWKYIIDTQFKPKCEVLGYCPENRGCGRYPNKI